jgi:CRISPR/Cas system-associated exonuclease Cas4 (RecB family)
VKFLKSDDFVKVWVTDKLKNELLQIFSEIEDIIREERIPKPTPHKRKNIDNCYLNLGVSY